MKTNSPHAWLLASRPKTLTGAMIPVLLAGALAWHQGCRGLYAWSLWVLCLLFACLMQVAANFINDYYDFQKGTDREDRLGPERACAQGWITPRAMRLGIGVVIVLACAIGLCAVAIAHPLLPWGGWEFVLLGLLCVVFAFLYTIGLSYLGYGDMLVLIFFGFVPVCGTYYLITSSPLIPTPSSFALPPSSFAPAILLSLISGIAIDALLVINNYRDRDQDRISGKRTLAVRFGEKFERYHYLAIGIIVFLLIVVLADMMEVHLPSSLLWYLCSCGYLCLHINTGRRMIRIRQGRALNAILGETSRNMFLMALLLSLALIV